MRYFVRAFTLTAVTVPLFYSAIGAMLAAEKSPKKFEIVRDPSLGKPIITLRRAPKDSQGRDGTDVFEQFLNYVRDGDVDAARKLCRFHVYTDTDEGGLGHASRKSLPRNPEIRKQVMAELDASEALFPSYVKWLQGAKRYTLGAIVKQKSVYWNMRVAADGIEQDSWPYAIYLCFEDETWEVVVHDLTEHKHLPP